MELLRHRIELPERDAVMKLYPISDTHLCSPEADEAAVRRLVAEIAADPYAYWGHGGDVTDCIVPGDPRWNLRAVDLSQFRDAKGSLDLMDLASWQVDKADELFRPIAHKALWVQEGNHEQTLYRYYHTHLVNVLLKRWAKDGLITPTLMSATTKIDGATSIYGGQTAFARLDFVWKHETWTKYVFTEHGATGGGSKGNSVNNFEGRLMDMDADLYFKGHVHKRFVWPETQLSWGAYKIRKRRRVMALTGSYLKSYGKGGAPAYPERAAYRPEAIGGVVALIEPATGWIDAMNIESLAMAQKIRR